MLIAKGRAAVKPAMRWLAVLVILLACADGVSAQQQQTPDPVSTGLIAKMPQAVKGVTGLAENAVLHVQQFCQTQLRGYLMPHCESVFIALFFPILIAEFAFTGIRIALRAPIVDQIATLVVNTFLLIIIYTKVPLGVIDFAKDQLQSSGRAMGASIVQMTNNYLPNALQSSPPSAPNIGGPQNEVEPIDYWFLWIGVADLQKTVQKPADLSNYKFSPYFIASRIWGDPNLLNLSEQGVAGNSENFIQSLVQSAGQGAGGVLDAARTTFLGFMPFYVLAYAVSVASTQLGAFAAVIFGALSILIGAHFCYAVVYSLGFAVMPLLYFRSFNKIWAQYLTYLTAIALLPMFYYLFSAIGYAFSTLTFQLLFPPPQGGQTYGSFATVLEGIFFLAIDTVCRFMSPLTEGLGILSIIRNVARAIGLFFAGSSVITTFVAGGVAFSGLSIGAAFRWNQAFASEEMLGRVNEFFIGLQSSLGSSLGQMYGQGIQRMSNAAGGFAGMLTGRM